ncbi:hypothetical protein GCK32_010219, partial [Trichostrongylus colubriformis]
PSKHYLSAFRFHAENNDEGTEFNNPLYSRQSVIVDSERGALTAEEEALEEKKLRGRSRTDRTHNDYATLDEMTGTSSSSSRGGQCTEPLLAESREYGETVDEYEMPYSNGVRSPEARIKENQANAQRAGNLYT